MSMERQDEEQLRLLSILYYVWGGLGLLFSCCGGVYVLGMSGFFFALAERENQAPPAWVGGLMGLFGILAVLVMVVVAGLSVYAGKCIADRRRHGLCVIVAALTCLSFPLGTALGVFTLIVLSRPSVKAVFNSRSLPG